MYYIYCYTNKLNDHKYVGQTNNLQRRIREHRSCAQNPKASSYNDLIHQKIREYGENNFRITILEEGESDDVNYINAREQYWIQEKESFRGWGKGYNSDLGGNKIVHSSILTDQQLAELKEDIKKGISYLELENKYHVSSSFISSINHGVYFNDPNEIYPLYKFYKTDREYDELIELLVHSTYSLKKISEMLGMGYSTVKKINAGTLRKGLYPSYPIREKRPYELKADKIKKMLLETDFPVSKIAQFAESSEETVRRINKGETNFDPNLKYPLR